MRTGTEYKRNIQRGRAVERERVRELGKGGVRTYRKRRNKIRETDGLVQRTTQNRCAGVRLVFVIKKTRPSTGVTLLTPIPPPAQPPLPATITTITCKYHHYHLNHHQRHPLNLNHHPSPPPPPTITPLSPSTLSPALTPFHQTPPSVPPLSLSSPHPVGSSPSQPSPPRPQPHPSRPPTLPTPPITTTPTTPTPFCTSGFTRMQLTLHATRRTPHGASRLVHAMSMPACSVQTRYAPCRNKGSAVIRIRLCVTRVQPLATFHPAVPSI